MNRKELQQVLKVLGAIKDPDEHVRLAKAYVEKDLAAYDARRGQLLELGEERYSFL